MDVQLQRLNRLSDLIFASSMTILVLLLEFPTVEQIDSRELFEAYLLESLPRLYLFIITFIVVGVYWMKNLDQYQHIVKTNTAHIWLQLLSLAFVVLLPWSNSLLELKPDLFPVRLFYGLDIFLIGIFSHLAWRKASKKRELISNEIDEETIKKISGDSLSEPLISIAAIIAAIIKPEFFDYVFTLIPISFIAQKRVKTAWEKWKYRKK